MLLSTDYIVIGGGVIGCATALELARQGASVTILERGQVGGESSWAGGGILFPLLPWDYKEPVTALTQWSVSLYPEWIRDVQGTSGLNVEYQVSGMLVLPEFDGSKAEMWCRANQVRFEYAASRGLMPERGGNPDALWLPDVAQVRNPRLIKALAECLRAGGTQLMENTDVIDIQRVGNKIASVRTSQGEISGGRYIIAGGSWSHQVLGGLAPELPIKPIRGQMLLFKVNPGELSHIVLRNGVYLIPRRDGHVLVGSTLEDVGFDKSTTKEAATQLHAAAAGIFPRLAGEQPIQHWAGLRPGSPDNIPVISRHPDIENLYVNSGHFRYGVTMAPGSAKLLCNMIFDQPQPFDVSPYCWPARG